MEPNIDLIGEDLFNKIRSRFNNLTLGNAEGIVTNDPSQARFFDFEYKENAKVLGNISISLDENNVSVLYQKDFLEDQDSSTKQHWYGFLKELRMFAKKRLLNFDVRDITKSNLNKRDYQFLSTKSGDSSMNESKLYGTSKTSFQDIGNARLSIKHSQPINAELPAGRTQHIQNIYIENNDGERFKYPLKHLGGARAMARHVAEGGLVHDDFGKHIVELSQELGKLRKFRNYVNRSSVMAEGLSEYSDIVNDRIATVKKTIENLQKPTHYKSIKENFSVAELETVPEELAQNWIDQLTIKQFNEELQDVFPYIYKLISEKTKIQELGPVDLIERPEHGSNIKIVKHEMKLPDNFMIVSVESRAQGSVYGLLDQKDKVLHLLGKFGQVDSYVIRPVTTQTLQYHSSGPIDQSGRLTSKYLKMLQKVGSNKKPASENAEFSKRNADDLTEYTDGDKIKFTPFKKALEDGFEMVGITNEFGPMFALMDKQDQTLIIPRELGQAIAIDIYKIRGKKKIHVYSGGISNAGPLTQKYTNYVHSMNQNKPQATENAEFTEFEKWADTTVDNALEQENQIPVTEFVLSMYDRETGQFPKGETAILTAVEKDYGEKYINPAKQFIEAINQKFQEYHGYDTDSDNILYDEEVDVEESGLQYYIGKKKYGKDGMKALAKAGRNGANQEELGKIRDQYIDDSADILRLAGIK